MVGVANWQSGTKRGHKFCNRSGNTAMRRSRRYIWVGICLLALGLWWGCKKEPRSDSSDEANFSYRERNFGASASDFLSARRFTSLIVEVQYMEGFKPDEAALHNLRSFLQSTLHKPEGIVFRQTMIPAVADTVVDNDAVRYIQKEHRSILPRNGQMALYILYTNGRYENPNVLGHAFNNTCIVMYGKTIKQHEQALSFPTQTTLETTVLLHEMGHLLGLLEKGKAMEIDHEDTAHEAHCNNPTCVMYWSMSIKPSFGPLVGDAIPCFDSACLRDLARKREEL